MEDLIGDIHGHADALEQLLKRIPVQLPVGRGAAT